MSTETCACGECVHQTCCYCGLRNVRNAPTVADDALTDAVPPGPWPPDRYPTPAEWASWVADLTPARRAEVGERVIEWSETAMRCFVADHDRLVADLSAQIARARAEGARDALNAAADEAMKFAVFADAAAWLRERAAQHEEQP